MHRSDASQSSAHRAAKALALMAYRFLKTVQPISNSCARCPTNTIYPPTRARSVNKANIELLKQRWVDAGRPRYPDWAALMAGVVDPTHMVPVQRPHG